MIRTITHKHLKRQFNILETADDLTPLFTELKFSTLLLPVAHENNTVSFPLLQVAGKKYAPVFTDIHEYNKCGLPDDFTLTAHDFEFYFNLLDERIDGIIIDVEGERFPLTKEIQDFVKPNYIFDYDPNVFTLREMRMIKDSIDNTELEEFLADESNFWDYDKLIDLLLKSDVFKVVLSKDDLTDKVENGVISLHDVDMLPTAATANLTDSYALIYSSEEEVRPKNDPMHPYLQLVNMPELIRRVLLDDLDGIVLNENSQNITIPREYLLDFMKNFNCPNIDKYDNYAFPLVW